MLHDHIQVSQYNKIFLWNRIKLTILFFAAPFELNAPKSKDIITNAFERVPEPSSQSLPNTTKSPLTVPLVCSQPDASLVMLEGKLQTGQSTATQSQVPSIFGSAYNTTKEPSSLDSSTSTASGLFDSRGTTSSASKETFPVTKPSGDGRPVFGSVTAIKETFPGTWSSGYGYPVFGSAIKEAFPVTNPSGDGYAVFGSFGSTSTSKYEVPGTSPISRTGDSAISVGSTNSVFGKSDLKLGDPSSSQLLWGSQSTDSTSKEQFAGSENSKASLGSFYDRVTSNSPHFGSSTEAQPFGSVPRH
jgi:hypothetical protein